METEFVKMVTSTNPYFLRITHVLLRRNTLNYLYLSKEKSISSKKILLIQTTSRKNKYQFFNTNNFSPLSSKPNTNTKKQDYSRTINTSPRNYNTHSTCDTIKAPSKPKIVTKEIIPTKKGNSHFKNFSTDTG